MGNRQNKRKRRNKKTRQMPAPKIEKLLKDVYIPSKLLVENTKKLKHTEIQAYLILNPKIVSNDISTRFFEIPIYKTAKKDEKSSCCDFIGCDPTLKKRAYIVEAKECFRPERVHKSYKQLKKQEKDRMFENMETRIYGAFGIKNTRHFVLLEYVQGPEGKLERLDKIGLFKVSKKLREEDNRFSRLEEKIAKRM